MTRCLKFIKQDEGIDYIPSKDDVELPKMEGIKYAEDQIREEQAKSNSPTKTPAKPDTPKPPIVT